MKRIKPILKGRASADRGVPEDPLPAPKTRAAHCPLRVDARRAASLGKDLTAALRRLKRRQKSCRHTCPLATARPGLAEDGAMIPTCAQLELFNTLVQTAVSTVLEEWDRL
jgi:hypothetical protein